MIFPKNRSSGASRNPSKQNIHVVFKLLVIAAVGALSLVTSHIALAPRSMATMEHGSSHSSSLLQCQTVCSNGIIGKPVSEYIRKASDNDKDEIVALVLCGSVSVVLLGVLRVKILYLLSSWRPPDRILLFGHYSDGL